MTDCSLLQRVQCGVSSCRRQCRLAQPESPPSHSTYHQSHQSKSHDKKTIAGEAGKQNNSNNKKTWDVISLVIAFFLHVCAERHSSFHRAIRLLIGSVCGMDVAFKSPCCFLVLFCFFHLCLIFLNAASHSVKKKEEITAALQSVLMTFIQSERR